MSSHMGPPPQHMSMMRPRAPFHLLNFDASVEYAWGQDVGQVCVEFLLEIGAGVISLS